MATYDYRCSKCDDVHEEFHKMDAKPRIKCPECGSSCKKIISGGTGVKFIGPGYYANDYGINNRIRKHIEKSPNGNQGDGSGMLGEDRK